VLIVLADEGPHRVVELGGADLARISRPELGGVDVIRPVAAHLIDGLFVAALPQVRADGICHKNLKFLFSDE